LVTQHGRILLSASHFLLAQTNTLAYYATELITALW